MFDVLKSLFSGNMSDQSVTAELKANDVRLAEAALMFHVIQADGEIVDAERQRMSEILSADFDLSDDQMAQLFEDARSADNEAVDLYRFTSLLKAQLEQERLIEIVENLWEMVFADAKLHELEDNVVWRIADLLNVETPDRMALKKRVRIRRGI